MDKIYQGLIIYDNDGYKKATYYTSERKGDYNERVRAGKDLQKHLIIAKAWLKHPVSGDEIRGIAKGLVVKFQS